MAEGDDDAARWLVTEYHTEKTVNKVAQANENIQANTAQQQGTNEHGTTMSRLDEIIEEGLAIAHDLDLTAGGRTTSGNDVANTNAPTLHTFNAVVADANARLNPNPRPKGLVWFERLYRNEAPQVGFAAGRAARMRAVLDSLNPRRPPLKHYAGYAGWREVPNPYGASRVQLQNEPKKSQSHSALFGQARKADPAEAHWLLAALKTEDEQQLVQARAKLEMYASVY